MRVLYLLLQPVGCRAGLLLLTRLVFDVVALPLQDECVWQRRLP